MCSITINNVLHGYFRLKKNKLKWLGSLEDLKAFVLTEISEETTENAAWRSPSGGTWQFDSEMLSVTWHSKSQNIYFKGEYGDDLTKRVHSYVNQSHVDNDQTVMSSSPTKTELAKSIDCLLDDEDEDIGDTSNKDILSNTDTSEDDGMTNIKNNIDSSTNEKNPDKFVRHHCEFIQEAQSPNEQANRNLSTTSNLHKDPINLHGVPQSYIPLGQTNKNFNPEFEIGVMNFKLENFAEKVSNKLDDLAIEINNIKENKAYSIVVLESRIDELKKEKLDLFKVNAELRKENTTMKQTISEINSINKNLENEKSSLLTAIQLIQNDCNTKKPGQNLNDKTANTNSRVPTDHESNSIQTETSDINPEHNTKSTKVAHESLSFNLNLGSKPVHKRPRERKETETKTKEGKEKESNTPALNEQIQNQPAHSKNPETIIVGDSMVKGLRPDKISKSVKHKTQVKSFPGATVEDLTDYIKPSLKRNPKNIIIHVGTNDLKRKRAKDIAKNIERLCQSIKVEHPQMSISVSEIIQREDNQDLAVKASAVNKELARYSEQKKFYFIKNENIDKRKLNLYGLHLNKQGSAALAKNIISHVNCLNYL